jgi:hypothetical protein
LQNDKKINDHVPVRGHSKLTTWPYCIKESFKEFTTVQGSDTNKKMQMTVTDHNTTHFALCTTPALAFANISNVALGTPML